MSDNGDVSAVSILADLVSDLHKLVRESSVESAAFRQEMKTCRLDAQKTHHAMFLDNGEAVISKVKAFELHNIKVDKQLARIDKILSENRKGDKEVKIAWIKVLSTIVISVLTTLGAVYMAYLKSTGGL